MRKKLLFSSLIIIFIGVIFLASGPAQSVFANGLESPIKHETFQDLIAAIINFIFNVSLVFAPLMIIIGGFYFVGAAGDISKIQTGKRIILYTLIGFIIILFARGFIALIREVFQVVG